MNKKELACLLQRKSRERGLGLSVGEFESIIDDLTSSVRYAVGRAEEVRLGGFGKFYQAKRNGRTVASYFGNEKKMYDVPAKNVISFRPDRATARVIK